MEEETLRLAGVYAGWEADQQRLVSLIGALTQEQLALRAAPHLRTVSALVSHIVAARARMTHWILREGDDDLDALAYWDGADQPAPPMIRAASELVMGLRRPGASSARTYSAGPSPISPISSNGSITARRACSREGRSSGISSGTTTITAARSCSPWRPWHRNPRVLGPPLQTSHSFTRRSWPHPVPRRSSYASSMTGAAHRVQSGRRWRTDDLFSRRGSVAEDTVTLADVYAGWDDFNKKLVEALAPLTGEQLDLRVAPSQRSAREIISHLVRTRASWFQLLGATDPEWTPYLRMIVPASQHAMPQRSSRASRIHCVC